MQRITTGIRQITGLLAFIALLGHVAIAQPGNDAATSPATADEPVRRDKKTLIDPLTAFDPGAEILQIPLTAGFASALLRDARSGPVQGTVLLLPGDQRPYPGTAIGQLYRLLPDHRWQVVVLSLAPLPASRYGQLFPVQTREGATAGEPGRAASGESRSTTLAPADATTHEEAQYQPADDAVANATGSAKLPENHSEWELDGTRRIAGAIDLLAKRGVNELWLIGEGYGAQIAARYLADNTPATLLGVSYINAQVPPELEASWSNDPKLPALDILDPRMGRNLASWRRQLATSAMTENYQQVNLARTSAARFGDDSLVSRRIRGWMSRQLRADS